MSAREWKPGDVAMVTWSAMGELRTDMRFRCYRKALGGHVWESPDGTWIGDATAKKVRPLVVIDPEFQDFRGAVDYLRKSGMFNGTVGMLEEQMQPPKPEEPQGLGAVVESTNGDLWVRLDANGVWACASDERKTATFWPQITAVRVLSEGVTA